jgi:hypothetical protein
VAAPASVDPPTPAGDADMLVILIAPNVSEQMGGEAMKALQILREMRRALPNTLQITHERTLAEVTQRLRIEGVHYVKDTPVALAIWRSVLLRFLLGPWFSWKAVRLAERLADAHARPGMLVLLHQVGTNPVMPRTSQPVPNVLGRSAATLPPFGAAELLSASLAPAALLQFLALAAVVAATPIHPGGGRRHAPVAVAAGVGAPGQGVAAACRAC